MTPVTETHPDLLGARHDMAEVTGLLDSCASRLAGEANELNTMVREISEGHTPENLIRSAQTVVAAGDTATRAYFLSLGIRDQHQVRKMTELMSSVVTVLNEYAQATLAEDAALWMNWVPARAAQARPPHT